MNIVVLFWELIYWVSRLVFITLAFITDVTCKLLGCITCLPIYIVAIIVLPFKQLNLPKWFGIIVDTSGCWYSMKYYPLTNIIIKRT